MCIRDRFILEGLVGQGVVDRFVVEPWFNFMVTQVGGDMHHFQTGFRTDHFQRLIDRQVERHRRTIDAAGQRVVLDLSLIHN